jgi:NADPH:quinone reductase-like Zn-dependent oxidoreductase
VPAAVRFDRYGDVDVLDVVDVERPKAGAGQALVRVRAAGINPGEAAIREGLLHERWPATFPSGQGSDFAGVVEEVGDGVDSFGPGDEVIGFTDQRASHAEYVVVPADQLTRRPPNVPWDVAGALFVAGSTAYAAVRAVNPREGETVVVSAAAGGVGSLVVQLARLAGASVIGLAGEDNHGWLRDHDVTPVSYANAHLADRIREASENGIDAFVDTFGADYVELALELGVAPERIDTIANFQAGQKYGVKTDGTATAASADVLAELAALIDQGKLEVPIARVYPLGQVRDAYRELERRHTRGKIVLEP